MLRQEEQLLTILSTCMITTSPLPGRLNRATPPIPPSPSTTSSKPILSFALLKVEFIPSPPPNLGPPLSPLAANPSHASTQHSSTILKQIESCMLSHPHASVLVSGRQAHSTRSNQRRLKILRPERLHVFRREKANSSYSHSNSQSCTAEENLRL